MQKELFELLKLGMIEESHSPIVLVLKKHGSIWFCVEVE